MDLDQLRALVETVRRGGFGEAAAALGISQSAVSRRVAALEGEVGSALLERTRPAVTPTRAGLEVLAFAESMLQGWAEVRQRLQGRSAALGRPRRAAPGGPLSGRLHVAASTAPAEYLLPPLLAEFGAAHPGVQLEMHVLNSDSVEACVHARHCEVGFMGRLPRQAGAVAVVLAEDEIVLVAARHHPLARRGTVALEELTDARLVLRERGSGTWDAVRHALAAAGADLPPHRVIARLGSAGAVLAAVAASEAVGFVSALALQRAGRADLAALRLNGLPIRRPLVMLHPARRLAPATAAFVAFLRRRTGA